MPHTLRTTYAWCDYVCELLLCCIVIEQARLAQLRLAYVAEGVGMLLFIQLGGAATYFYSSTYTRDWLSIRTWSMWQPGARGGSGGGIILDCLNSSFYQLLGPGTSHVTS